MLCHTPFFGSEFDKYRDEFILIDGYSKDDIGLAHHYGFKKAISVLELLALYPKASPTAILDL